MQKNQKYYSWVPNITGHINFEYISDNIVQEDESRRIFQCHSDKASDVKCFLLENWNFSDNTHRDKKGEARHIFVELEKKETIISGKYYEFIPANLNHKDRIYLNKFISDFKRKDNNCNLENPLDSLKVDSSFLKAKFEIEYNGKIEIEYIGTDSNSRAMLQEESVPLLTYRAIKYILHKDIFHGEEEDKLIDIYSYSSCEESIAKNLIKYIKSYERLIKDVIKTNPKEAWIKKDFFESLTERAKGINSYFNSYIHIFKLREKEKNILITKNIIASMENMINEVEITSRKYERNKEIKLFVSVFTMSLAILLSSWFKHEKVSSDIMTSSTFLVVIIIVPATIAMIIFRYELFTIPSFNSYIKSAYTTPEKFINRRLGKHGIHLGIFAIVFLLFFVVCIFILTDAIKSGISVEEEIRTFVGPVGDFISMIIP